MRLLASILATTILLLGSRDAAPQGTIDKIDPTTIAGTASDPDAPDKAVTVHLYVDDVLFDTALADKPGHRFEYRHAPFGGGAHTVVAQAVGVDASGQANGVDRPLTGSGEPHDFGCEGIERGTPAYDWCVYNQAYWIYRQKDTTPLFNKHIWIGVDNSYGGTIFQLYGEDRSTNLLQEHGGGALQLSVWGYERVAHWKADRYYRKSPPANPACDATAYPTPAACEAGGASCGGRSGLRPSQGRQITTCDNVCNGWEVAAPWNPLQAQGAQCSWDERNAGSPPSLNDVSVKEPFTEDGLPGWHTVHRTVSNFTKGVTSKEDRVTTFPDLSFDQRVTLGDVYAKVQYTARYAAGGPYRLGSHPQEIPAIYANKGMAVYAYRSNEPEKAACLHGTPECCPQGARGCAANTPSSPIAWNTRPIAKGGSWWGVCDATRTRCLTVATFDSGVIDHDIIERTAEGYGTLTAAAAFALTPGTVKTFTIYVFPYRYDRVIDGRSIAQRIDALRPR
jgi:hypothetical protein